MSVSDEAAFGVSATTGADAVVVRLTGELDLAVVERATAALIDALDSSPTVVVDLRHLDFMDSTGLHCLIDAKMRADQRGSRFALLNGSGPAHRLLTVTGMDMVFEMADDLHTLDPPIGSVEDAVGPPTPGFG